MSQLWHLILYQPLVNALIFAYQLLFQNLGLAIMGVTVVIRGLLIPLTLPTLRATNKIRELAPEIEKLKKKHSKDKQAFAQAQMELYRQHGANPAAGCLPQIIQLLVLVALYQAFNQVLRVDGDVIEKLNQVLYSGLQLPAETQINTRFLYLDLSQPDTFRWNGLPIPGFFLVAAAVVQFLSSRLMMPQAKKAERKAKKTEGEMDDMAAVMQKQMLYLFPLMTIFIGFSFPSGLVLYWFIFSLLTAFQYYLVNRQSDKKK